MIIYNVTVKVDPAVAAEWLQWLRSEHAPEIMATDCFTDFKVVRLLDVDDSEGPTYAVQYTTDSRTKYDEYIRRFAAGLRRKAAERWGHRFVSFDTVMQVVA